MEDKERLEKLESLHHNLLERLNQDVKERSDMKVELKEIKITVAWIKDSLDKREKNEKTFITHDEVEDKIKPIRKIAYGSIYFGFTVFAGVVITAIVFLFGIKA